MDRPRFTLRALLGFVTCFAIGIGLIRGAFDVPLAFGPVFLFFGAELIGATIGGAVGGLFGREFDGASSGALVALVFTCALGVVYLR